MIDFLCPSLDRDPASLRETQKTALAAGAEGEALEPFRHIACGTMCSLQLDPIRAVQKLKNKLGSRSRDCCVVLASSFREHLR